MSLHVHEKQVVQDNSSRGTCNEVDSDVAALTYVGKRLRIYVTIVMLLVPLLYLINIILDSGDSGVSWILLVYAMVPILTFELSSYLCDYRKPQEPNKE